MDSKQIKTPDSQDKRFFKYLFSTAAILLVLRYFDVLLTGGGVILQVISPLLLGCVLAFALNLIMVRVEKLYLHLIRSCKSDMPRRMSRVISIISSILLIILFFLFLSGMVVPKISEVFASTAKALPLMFQSIQDFFIRHEEFFPQLSEYINSLNIDWQDIFKRTLQFASSGFTSAFSNVFGVITSVTGTISNVLFAFIFAIYILAGKETLARHFKKLLRAILPEKMEDPLFEVLSVFNHSFASFITGQCMEAVILGTLCIVGMALCRFPYASVIGTLVGATALIPVLGAYIGGGIGFALIFTVSPMKALYFLLFLCILQQLEGNLIYPRVVGASIGLPGIWVFAAVTVGGSLAGITGMLVGVPLMAACYQLTRRYVQERP